MAQLWEHSQAAKEEFGEQTPMVRRAIALARFSLDPLAVMASLCRESDTELSSLPHLSPLKRLLAPQEMVEGVERILVTAVAQMGVDLNLAVTRPWLAAKLAFVPGLGPRKAAALVKAVTRNGDAREEGEGVRVLGYVRSRLEIHRRMNLGRRVFKNAGPFLRIRRPADEDADPEAEFAWCLLDEMRLPVSTAVEEIAVKLAGRMLGRRGEVDLDSGTAVVNEAGENPDASWKFDVSRFLPVRPWGAGIEGPRRSACRGAGLSAARLRCGFGQPPIPCSLGALHPHRLKREGRGSETERAGPCTMGFEPPEPVPLRPLPLVQELEAFYLERPDEIRKTGHRLGLPSLIDIQLEICRAHGDLRREYTRFSAKEIFQLRTGESDLTLARGAPMNGRVRAVKRAEGGQIVILTLDNGVSPSVVSCPCLDTQPHLVRRV